MNSDAQILVATDSIADADIVQKILRKEFENILVSTRSRTAIADFNTSQPDVLVLAFNALEKAQQYLRTLDHATVVHNLHDCSILLLCNSRELQSVYELCKASVFDDYVLFWPLGYDVTRLPMAVHKALNSGQATARDSLLQDKLLAQTQRISKLEMTLQQVREQTAQQIGNASDSLLKASRAVLNELDTFTKKMAGTSGSAVVEIKDHSLFRQKMLYLKQELIGKHLGLVASTVCSDKVWETLLTDTLEAPSLVIPHEEMQEDTSLPRVLIVDDDDFQHKILKQVLAGTALQLESAKSGAEALAFLSNHSVDLILLDIEMPDTSGVDLLHQLRAMPELDDIRIIMMTGRREKDTVVQCRKAGAWGYVLKPFDKLDLFMKVQSALSKPGSHVSII